MEDSIQTCVNTIGRVDLEPKEEVVLVIAPNDLHYYPAEGYLRNNYAIPDPVKQLEPVFFVDSSSLYKEC